MHLSRYLITNNKDLGSAILLWDARQTGLTPDRGDKEAQPIVTQMPRNEALLRPIGVQEARSEKCALLSFAVSIRAKSRPTGARAN
jgi:hypothetical protein